MIIPETVKIGGMVYTVTLSDKILIVDTTQCKGLVNYEMHTIGIDNTVQDTQGVEETFWHEAIHAIVRERNIKFDCGDNEVIVEELAKGLHQVIVDNPDIFR